MKNLSVLTGITAVALAVALFSAPAVFAKNHDQGLSENNVPGQNVGEDTVGPAQTLGAVQSDGKGKTAEQAGGNLGKSGTAGRDSDGPGNSGQGHGNSFNE